MVDTELISDWSRVVYVPLPDLETRRKVLEVHTRKIPINDQVDLEFVAASTQVFYYF